MYNFFGINKTSLFFFGISKTKRYIDTLGVHSWEPPGTSRYAQHMIEFVRSIIPFCLHSLEVARKLLVQ